jgi:hypothetical protein
MAVEAELFVRRMAKGRNGAILVSARGAQGAVDCVVKLSAGLENPALAPLPYLLEWLAAAVAEQLGVRAAHPHEVQITPEFAGAIGDPAVRKIALASLGPTFGSEFVGPPFTQWTVELPHGELRESAATLLAFDAFIHNPDRRADNPNVFVSRSELLAFDHGDAFSFLFAIGGDASSDALLPMLEWHAMRGWLRGRAYTFDRFRSRLAGLTDEVLGAIVASTPACWQKGPAAGKLERIIDVLRGRRDAVDQWLPKVEAWLEQ